MQTHEIMRDDGVRLAAWRWPTPRLARAVVLIVHGVAEHGRRYARFAGRLNAADLEVWAFDLRGHGATTRAIDHGHIGTDTHWQTLVDDVEAVRERAAAVANDRPVILFGHSLGSIIAQAALQDHGRRYVGAVLSAPTCPSRLLCRVGALMARMEAARVDPTGRSPLLQWMTFGAYARALAKRTGVQRTRCDWLSSRDDAVDDYMADPQAGFDMRAISWQRLLPGMAHALAPHSRRRAPADLPLLIAAGRDDPVGRFGRDPQALAHSYANNGQLDVTLHLYDGARHELINDCCADAFRRNLLHWLAARHVIAAANKQTESPTACDN